MHSTYGPGVGDHWSKWCSHRGNMDTWTPSEKLDKTGRHLRVHDHPCEAKTGAHYDPKERRGKEVSLCLSQVNLCCIEIVCPESTFRNKGHNMLHGQYLNILIQMNNFYN